MLGIRHYQGAAIDLWQGDITTFVCDGMATSTNSQLDGSGGVNGAIHSAAGVELVEACRTIGSCETGKAVFTPAGQLPARFVIHAVGPVWSGGNANESNHLASAYQAIWQLAEEQQLRHVAVPSISTGNCKYPVAQAADVAMTSIKQYFTVKRRYPQRISFVLFDSEHYQHFQQALFQAFPELNS